jgi:uncharacterized membrane protein SpoIIM required for sporulation
MTREHFVRDRGGTWRELEELVGAAGRRPRRLGADGLLRLGGLYRSAAADLALARARFPGDPVVARLEDLVGRARHLVYAAPPRRLSFVRFMTTGYWQLAAERPVLLGLAAALLFGPAALAAGWALEDPGAAIGLLPAEYQSIAEPRTEDTDLGLSAGEEAGFSAEIFTNNVRVAFLAFAGGIAFGVVTAAVLLLNGVLLGAVTGLAWGVGSGAPFVELVAAHGVLELSCIVVAGAAGLRLGWSMIAPGRRTRVESVTSEARRTVLVALGTAPWLVLAGLVEGFVTPQGIGVAAALAVGLSLGALYWTALVWRGVLTPGTPPSL